MTYHYMTWFFLDIKPQLKDKYLVVWPKGKAIIDSELAGLVLKMPGSRLGHTQDLFLQWCCDLVIVKPTIYSNRSPSLTDINNPSGQPVLWFLSLNSKTISSNVIKSKMKIIYVSDVVWMWVHRKYGMSQIIHKIGFIWNKWLILTHCYWQWLIGLTKK